MANPRPLQDLQQLHQDQQLERDQQLQQYQPLQVPQVQFLLTLLILQTEGCSDEGYDELSVYGVLDRACVTGCLHVHEPVMVRQEL